MTADDFKDRSRTQTKYFSRNRVLNFTVMVLLLIQKSAKSMQLVLNEFSLKQKLPLVTSSAFSQARKHLKPEAFIELNQKSIVEVMYSDDEYRTYKGYRVLGIDGSKVYLPPEPEIIDKYGGTVPNQHSEKIEPYSVVSVLYDELNEIALDAVLGPAKAYEVDLAMGHLAHTQAGDLLVFDRNYVSYLWLATLVDQQLAFVGRCSRASFKVVQEMFADESCDSRIVTIAVTDKQRKAIKAGNLPTEISVRLVRLVLDNGEVEVLITSLVDQTLHPTAEFAPLYCLRWGSETFYHLLKSRLLLENFTGKTVIAVEQDFHATIYLSGLETLLTLDANDTLHQQSLHNRYRQKVNHAVSFNAIKNHAFDLFFDPHLDDDALHSLLTQLFLMKPVLVRPQRSISRTSRSPSRSLRFLKRFRKICF